VVTVRVGGRSLRQILTTGSSYLAAHDPRAHFGLGDATTAAEVHVRWPNGREWRQANVAADQYLTAR
jgi:hypothetical protein